MQSNTVTNRHIHDHTWWGDQIIVDQKVLRHLDELDLGMEKKKKERGRKLRLYKMW